MVPVIDIFRQVFESKKYTEQSPSPIFPSPDPTTLFTSATISVWKNRVLAGNPEKAFVIQPCLRTQNLGRALDNNFDPEYLSSFVMLGTICPVKEFTIDCTLRFFNSFPGLAEKILIRSSGAIKNDLFERPGEHCRVEYDTREPGYYHWEYGDDSLTGIGVTFAIEQSDGVFLDIGNLVLMSRNRTPIAVEFGFGWETFTSRLSGRGSPYAASQEYLRLGFGLLPAEKCLGDCLIVALKLFECGVIPGTGKAASVMRKALRNACFLALRNYGDSAIWKIHSLAQALSTNSSWLELIKKTGSVVHDSVEAFCHEVAHMKRHVSGFRLEKKIEGYRERYGIPEQF